MSPLTCDNVYKAIGMSFMAITVNLLNVDIRCDRLIGYQLGAGTLVAESILAMRTWVIWHRNPYIGAIVLTGLVVFWVPVFYFLAQALNSLVCASDSLDFILRQLTHSLQSLLHLTLQPPGVSSLHKKTFYLLSTF